MQKSKLSLAASCKIFLCKNQIKSKMENNLCATIRESALPHLLSDEDGNKEGKGKHGWQNMGEMGAKAKTRAKP